MYEMQQPREKEARGEMHVLVEKIVGGPTCTAVVSLNFERKCTVKFFLR